MTPHAKIDWIQILVETTTRDSSANRDRNAHVPLCVLGSIKLKTIKPMVVDTSFL